jgi:hypothetical protein
MMDTFNDAQLIKLATMKVSKIMQTMQTHSVRDCLLFHRRLQESIVGFSKRNKHLVTLQWDLVCIAERIRKLAWQEIYNDYKVQILMKYPQISEAQLKQLTRKKTEEVLKKYSY